MMARKFSNIYYFSETFTTQLVTSKMYKNWGVTDFFWREHARKNTVDLKKLGFIRE